ncbi:MAG: glycosyltransferase family 2 protein [Bacteroidaceae bacterium]|nr:glycosyltransferase family 2 protein [Bacteroidaceae bacterium]
MKTGGISFIIPYYNVPLDMLHECIESILALSLQADEYEIIVVDDGSDVSPKVSLSQYANKIRYIRKENEGVSSARNLGLEMATGKYIQFIDADDKLIKSPYLYCLEQLKQESADMIVFDFCTMVQNQRVYSTEGPLSGVRLMANRNIRGTVCCLLFKRALLDNLLFNTDTAYGEDEEFTARLLLQTPSVLVTNANAYFYRRHEASAIQQTERHVKRLQDTRNVISRLNATANGLTDTHQKQALQRRVAQLTMDYIYNHIRMVGSMKELTKEIERLHNEGLFPLPDKNYTTKYTWFRRMTNSALGRRLLLLTIPLMKKER